ncbi:MAG: hypothetical protein M0R37_13465 [Bacteroidales bacterium]|nr:hypothetical protein [Bacteroidales bacterium]
MREGVRQQVEQRAGELGVPVEVYLKTIEGSLHLLGATLAEAFQPLLEAELRAARTIVEAFESISRVTPKPTRWQRFKRWVRG